MRILIVEPETERRSELVHLICELPGVVVSASVSGLPAARVALATQRLDVIVAGELKLWELTSLVSMADHLGCTVVEVTTDDQLVSTLTGLVARRAQPQAHLARLTARSKYLAFERDTGRASPLALAVHLHGGDARHPRGAQTLDLQEWLPRAIAQLRPLIPEYVELVTIVAAQTPAVQCIPAMLEHIVHELVLQACAHLPWGGTVWVTATPGSDDEVTLDVLENARGHIRDVVLRASQPARS